MNCSGKLAIVVMAWASTTSASIIFDNGPPAYEYNDPASQLSRGASPWTFNAGATDDFFLQPSTATTGEWLIRSFSWAGLIDDERKPIQAFNLIIWPNSGVHPAGGSPAGQGPDIGVALLFATIPGDGNQTINNQPGSHTTDYFYTVNLPVPFIAQPHTRYWLEVQAVFDGPPQWFWMRSTNSFGARPHQGFDSLNIPFWTPMTGDDLSFQVLGEPVPEPGAVALLSIGLLAIGSLRRRKYL